MRSSRPWAARLNRWIERTIVRASQTENVPGDRVGLWMKNRPEFVPALLGILNASAVAVPINNFLKSEEVSYILADSGTDVLITDMPEKDKAPAMPPGGMGGMDY